MPLVATIMLDLAAPKIMADPAPPKRSPAGNILLAMAMTIDEIEPPPRAASDFAVPVLMQSHLLPGRRRR